MPFKIAIASGKGGTGKTTVAINLFVLLNELYERKVELVDCDVEEPNDKIFFRNPEKVKEETISQQIPSINFEKCNYCRKCTEYCEFNAIMVIPHVEFAEVNSSLCHSCGACLVACEQNAITECPEPIGVVNSFKSEKGWQLTEGRLKIGSAMQTMLIKELKKRTFGNNEIVIYDSPPGTSCPVVETINDADYVVLAAEPTLFGMHDLKLMVELVRQIELPFGVIINKAGLGDSSIYSYLENENIELLGEIPFSKEYAKLYASADIMDSIPDKIRNCYSNILDTLNKKVMQYEGNNYFKW